MAKRKTVDVEVIKNIVNDICQFSENSRKGQREGAMNVLEEILHRTGNYRGFRYLGADQMEAGYSVGINWGFDNDNEARFF